MKKSKFLLAFLILFFNSHLSQGNEKAPKFGPERIRKCNDNNPEKIDEQNTLNINAHLNFVSKPEEGLGSDFMFEMSNPYCFLYFNQYWVTFRAAINAATLFCGGTPSIFPNPLKDILSQASNIVKCATGAVTQGRFTRCCEGNLPVLTAGASAAIQASILYGMANSALKQTRVCGYNWSNPTYKDDSLYNIIKNTDISYKEYLLTSNRIYRKEREEFSNSGRYFRINDVISQNAVTRNSNLITKNIDDNDCDDNVLIKMQPFYLRGLDSGNFNCPQYSDSQERKCCENLAKNYICLEDTKSNEEPAKRSFVFCKKGTTCSIELITTGNSYYLMEFMIKEREEGRVLCAESHNLCPYNFSVAGGTTYPSKKSHDPNVEESNKKIKDAFINADLASSDSSTYNDNTLPEDLPCKYSETQDPPTCFAKEKAYTLKNQCQYYSHCTITSDTPYTIRDNKINRYFSYACLDFKGSSKETTFILGNEIYLSAPIAQCFYETFGIIFVNKNGHTLCRSGETTDGTSCINDGPKVYEKNQNDGHNIFTKIQDNLRFAIKVGLTLAILFFGIKILISPGDVIGMSKRKEMILLIFKIGIVAYFALGDAWQTIFFDAVYGSFPELVTKFFQYTSNEGDLCKFGDSDLIGKTAYLKYSYLKIFNILDCKLKYYLAFTPGTSFANVIGLIISTLFTGSYGFLISISLFFFVIMMIIIIMRALYLFVTTALAIVVYIFISPVIFPTLLFKQTTDIFNKWLMQLISFTLQPIILFVYIAIFIQASDLLILGKNPKLDGGRISCKSKEEDRKRLACVLNFDKFSSSSSFAIISVALPSAAELFYDLLSGGKMGIIIVVLRGVVGIYLLLKMFDLIPGIIDYIFGSSLDRKGEDVLNTFKSFVNKVSLANKMAGSLVWNKAFDMAEDKSDKKEDDDKKEGDNKKEGDKKNDSSGVV